MIQHDDPLCTLYLGDCVEVMRELPAESVDAVVTDPPYGLEFMGKEWDRLGAGTETVDEGMDESHPFRNGTRRVRFGASAATMQTWHEAWAREAFRVAKPGAHLLAFGGTRTYHRLASAIEDAGWEIRDCLVYAYASGFPKSASVAKASTGRSWGALLQGAPHSSGTDGDLTDDYPPVCRLCGQPLQSVSVVVLDAEPLSAGAPGCSHPDGPSVDIPLGNGRTYRACPSCLSCHLATPDCVHLASAPPIQPDAQGSSSVEEFPHTPLDDGQQLWTRQTLGGDTPDRSNGGSPSAAKPRRSDRADRNARTGQSEAYTHFTLGCPSCHQAYAQQATDRAGYGSALKPAWEPIVMARKPLRGTVAANVLAHGTGALNIDATRIGTGEELRREVGGWQTEYVGGKSQPINTFDLHPEGVSGRWPANLILTDPIFDGDTPGVVGGGAQSDSDTGPRVAVRGGYKFGGEVGQNASLPGLWHGDSGTYSRFFLIPKSSRSDREPLVRGVLEEAVVNITEGHGRGPVNTSKGDGNGVRVNKARENQHPTVKPLDLMRHLVRLVTPPGGAVLDPFLGSGTTAIAANAEGFRCIGIEKEREYLDIAVARMQHQPLGMQL